MQEPRGHIERDYHSISGENVNICENDKDVSTQLKVNIVFAVNLVLKDIHTKLIIQIKPLQIHFEPKILPLHTGDISTTWISWIVKIISPKLAFIIDVATAAFPHLYLPYHSS